MKRLIFGLLIVLTLCGCSDIVFANTIDSDKAIKSIIGEGEDQGKIGMTALGEAIRNRGTLKGVYGYRAIIEKNGKFYRKSKKGLRAISSSIVKQAEQAWKDSSRSNYVHGANHWENVKAFGMPDWAIDMEKTFEYKDHMFFRS